MNDKGLNLLNTSMQVLIATEFAGDTLVVPGVEKNKARTWFRAVQESFASTRSTFGTENIAHVGFFQWTVEIFVKDENQGPGEINDRAGKVEDFYQRRRFTWNKSQLVMDVNNIDVGLIDDTEKGVLRIAVDISGMCTYSTSTKPDFNIQY